MKKFANVVLYGCGISLFASSCVQKAEEKKLNVLFIMTDQQRYDMLSCAGNRYVSTPSLDRLAENGVRFEHNYCANPVSMPSRFAMATGRYAGEIGYTNNSTKPDTLRVLPVARESSVGNLFRNAGYQTVYSGYPGFYCGRTHMEEYGFTQNGTDYYEGPADFAENFLAGYNPAQDEPFFLYLSFLNPHDICYGAGFDPRFPDELRPHQIAATQKYIDLRKTLSDEEYRAQIPPVPANVEPNGTYAEMKAIGSGSRDWTEEQWDFYRWMYCRLVEDVEQQIGRILAALENSGLADHTIVVFTSDHGEMGQSHGLVFKSRLLEEATRTPLIISGPGVKKGVVDSKSLTSGIDLVPTLCDLTGIPVPENLSGKSLKPVLTGQTDKIDREYIIVESSSGYQINDGRYKYTAFTRGDKEASLMDILADPGEMSDKVADPVYVAEKERLHSLLMKEIKKITEQLPAEK